MHRSLRWAINDLRKLFELDSARREKYLLDANHSFIRKRKLPFAQTALLILSLLKKV